MVVRGLGPEAHSDSSSRLEALSVQGSRLNMIQDSRLKAQSAQGLRLKALSVQGSRLEAQGDLRFQVLHKFNGQGDSRHSQWFISILKAAS